MINITVFQSGTVIGDVGKIIAYEGQQYSEAIKITHPNLPGCEYFIQYKYNNTIYRNKLDNNDIVKLKIENHGYLKCQFIALNINNGIPQFISKEWQFIVNACLKIEPSHYPCNSPIHHHRPQNLTPNYCNCNGDLPNINFDSYQAYHKLSEEIKNEEQIRHDQITQIMYSLEEIKNYLNINQTTKAIYDFNECIEDGQYYALPGSISTPSINDTSTEEYVLDVKITNHTIIQEAYEADGDQIWYRTGNINVDNSITWTQWATQLVRVGEI